MKSNDNRVVFVRPRLLPGVSSLALFSIAACAVVACVFQFAGVRAAPAQATRIEVQLRSYAPPATGRLIVEPSERGGRVRLTVLGLPEPQTVSPYAQTYVVWAVSGGRVVRVGELRRDRGGNGGLAFDRPADFETYGVVVTAERSADADKPGSPALASRVDAARALYPPLVPTSTPTPPTPRATATPSRPSATPASQPLRHARTRATGGGGFYDEVDSALDARGGGRLITLDGSAAAPGARARARATTDAGRAYVRADFANVPTPSSVGANVYVLWAVLPDGRIVYMGSLPGTEDLNRAEIYVRTAGFETDDYTLTVTAERRRPVPVPSGERVLR